METNSKPFIPSGEVDILPCSLLATAIMQMVPGVNPIHWGENQKLLGRALKDYAEEVARVIRFDTRK